MKRSALFVGLILLAELSAPPWSLAQQTQNHRVVIVGFTYVPGQAGVPFGQTTQPAVPLVISAGDTVTATSLDDPIDPHTITADQCVNPNLPCSAATNPPLFDSPFISTAQSGDVSGVQSLPPGLYPFHCRVHVPFMHGVLEVQ